MFGHDRGAVRRAAAREGTFAALHGLYWLTVNLCSERALCSSWTTFTGATGLRCGSSPTSRGGSRACPPLLVGSLRSSEPEADLAMLQELASEPHAQVLVPGPLTAAAAGVVRDRLGEDVEAAFADACHSSTDGNPLLLNELLKALDADRVPPDAAHVDVVAELGPRAASRAVLLRLARLSEDALRVARAISVLGRARSSPWRPSSRSLTNRRSPPPRRARARRDPAARAAARLRAPARAGRRLPDLAPGERELRHERAATLLVRLGAPTEQIAAHLLVMPARGEDWVVDMLRAAASAAVARGDLDSAISVAARALDEPPDADLRFELLLELGQAEAMTSLPAAIGHLRGAYELADEPAARGHAADGLARALMFMQAPDEAVAIARDAQAELPGELGDSPGAWSRSSFSPCLRRRARRSLERLRRTANRRLRRARGRQPRRQAAWEWTKSAGPAESVARSRGALADGELIGRTA